MLIKDRYWPCFYITFRYINEIQLSNLDENIFIQNKELQTLYVALFVTLRLKIFYWISVFKYVWYHSRSLDVTVSLSFCNLKNNNKMSSILKNLMSSNCSFLSDFWIQTRYLSCQHVSSKDLINWRLCKYYWFNILLLLLIELYGRTGVIR